MIYNFNKTEYLNTVPISTHIRQYYNINYYEVLHSIPHDRRGIIGDGNIARQSLSDFLLSWEHFVCCHVVYMGD